MYVSIWYDIGEQSGYLGSIVKTGILVIMTEFPQIIFIRSELYSLGLAPSLMILLIGKPSSDYLKIDEDLAPSLKLGYDMACTDLVKNRECHERLKAHGERRHELEDGNRMHHLP